MHDLAIEQIGHGGKTDVRMRPHVEAVAAVKLRGAEMIEEDKRANHARTRRRQTAANQKVIAKIDRARHDHIGDGIALIGVAGGRIGSAKEAHGNLLKWSLPGASHIAGPARHYIGSHY